MTPDSLTSSNSISPIIKDSLIILAALSTIFVGILAWRKLIITKPKIVRLITSSNGSKVVLSVVNTSNNTITVKSVSIREIYFWFFKSSSITVDLRLDKDKNIVIPPNAGPTDNIIFRPPENVYYSKYVIKIKTSGGNCSTTYDPNSVVGLSANLIAQDKAAKRAKRNWIRRKLNL